MTTKDGTVWVASLGTLDFIRNGTVSSVRVPGEQVSSLLEDHQGNIWVGVDDGLFIYKDGRFRRIPEPDHHPLDTGVGLPTEEMDQIFSAFFTTKPQGSGMGLAISRSIVESHGGRLWASANSGAGATFHFTLPIQVTESSPLVA